MYCQGNTDQAGRAAFTAALNSGDQTRAEVVQTFSESQEFRNTTDMNVELYLQSLDGGVDILEGCGGNDILFGGSGADTFSFDGFSNSANTVLDFEADDSGGGVLEILFHQDFSTFEHVMAVTTQVGANTFIDLGDGYTITLNNMNMNDLNVDDFSFGMDELFF